MGNETSQQQDPQQQGADGAAGPADPGYSGASSGKSVAGLNQDIVGRQPVSSAAQRTNAGGIAALGEASESVLLTQLLQLLSQRPSQSLLLSDLGALLPQTLRTSVKERGGLRSWLQKHPELFQVSGQPGKESVVLTLGCNASSEGGPLATGSAHVHQDSATEVPMNVDMDSASHNKAHLVQDDDDEDAACCVQMRGLPYRATSQDVKLFLGRHVAALKDEQSVQLVLNRDGRPSGFARVQFTSPAAARAARDELHNAVMKTASDGGSSQERYVEIFLYSERPNKLRFRKGLGSADGPNTVAGNDEAGDKMKHQVIQECRHHMTNPGKSQLLLSMLGVALSPSSRLHLKKTDLGLKHFLSLHPSEFRVEGVKGREMITYLPAMPQSHPTGTPTIQKNPAAVHHAAFHEADTPGADRHKRLSKGATGGPATGSLNELDRTKHSQLEDTSPGLRSPGPFSPGGILPPGTPSDWGTPLQVGGAYDWDPRSRNVSQDTQQTQPAASPYDFMNSYDSAANWAAWGMPPPGVYWPPAVGVPPWGAMGGSSLPPWMMDPQMAGGSSSPHFGQGLTLTIPAAASPGSAKDTAPGAGDPAAEKSCMLRLRGLPFACSEQEVYAFFSKHDVIECVADVNKAVTFLQKTNGRPTGQAIVQMKSKQDAFMAQQALNGQWIGPRYIEVFPYTDDAEIFPDGVVKAEDGHVTVGSETELEVPSAGDTGGSGGSSSAMMVPGAAPWQQSVWDTGSGMDFESLMKQMHTQGAAVQFPEQHPALYAGGAGTGGDPTQVAGGAEPWNALFDFLKQGGAQPNEDNPAPGQVHQTGI